MKKISLSRGKCALVDDEDFEYLNQFKWWPYRDGLRWYATRNVKRNGIWTTSKMHHEVLPRVFGKETDHKDGNGLNNQRSNLRLVSRSQNRMNSVSPGNKFGYKGVSFDGRKIRNKFWARVRTLGRVYQSTYFETPIEAAIAYNEMALKQFGKYAKINNV